MTDKEVCSDQGMTRGRSTQEIIADLYESVGWPYHLADEIAEVFGIGKRNYRRRFHTVPNALFGDMGAAVELVGIVLPGWGWRMSTCCVSDDAWVFPDFNSPSHGERLKRDLREDIDWVDLTDVALSPSGRPSIALLISILKAKETIECLPTLPMTRTR